MKIKQRLGMPSGAVGENFHLCTEVFLKEGQEAGKDCGIGRAGLEANHFIVDCNRNRINLRDASLFNTDIGDPTVASQGIYFEKSTEGSKDEVAK